MGLEQAVGRESGALEGELARSAPAPEKRPREGNACACTRLCVLASEERHLQQQCPSPQTHTHLIITMTVEQRGC